MGRRFIDARFVNQRLDARDLRFQREARQRSVIKLPAEFCAHCGEPVNAAGWCSTVGCAGEFKTECMDRR